MIRAVAFDMDDTLYWERDYVRSGFAHVARRFGRSESEARALRAWLEAAFREGVRGNTFDRLLAATPGLAQRVSKAALVDAYRGHDPVIELAPGTADVLDLLAGDGFRLGLISDGPLASQTAKARSLGLARWLDPMLLTAAGGPGAEKPSHLSFESMARTWGLPHDELAYVADNPEKDFLAPRRLGWLTIRLRRPEQLRYAVEPGVPEFRAAVEIGRLEDLPVVLGLPEFG